MLAKLFSVPTIVSLALILTVADAASGECGDGICDAGGTVADDCCQPHDTPGCATPECEALVCDFDAFCCIAEWDIFCVDEAAEFCGDLCAGGGSGGEDCANCPEDCGPCDPCEGVDCDDGVACTDDACVEGECLHTPNDANCDDGQFCNGAEVCDEFLDCQGGEEPCIEGEAFCDEVQDACLTSDDVVVEMLLEVEALADTGVLNDGQDNSLTGQLERVLDAIDQGRLNVACNRLSSFTQHVFSLVENGVMTEAEGAVLLDAADIVDDLIDCDGRSGFRSLGSRFRSKRT